MQSFLQWKQVKRHINHAVQLEEKSTEYLSSSSQLNTVQAPNSSLNHNTHLSDPISHPTASRHSSRSVPLERADEEKSDACSIPRFENEIGLGPGGVRGTDEDKDGNPATLVETKEQDGCDPRDWPRTRKFRATIIVFLIVFVCGWASAAMSSSNAKAAQDFHVSKEAETLATALFLFGIAFGSLISGPISETAGRNPTYLIFMFLYMTMILAGGLAPNFAANIIFRFFAGLFASPPLTIYGGSLADMYDNADRSFVWPIFALSPILGPVLAPVAGGWIIQSTSLSWRWVEWVTLIMSGAVFVLAFLFLPETFSPMLLQWKAVALRKATGDTRFKSQLELQASLMSRLKTNTSRPITFFTREPIVILIGFYLTLIYVLVFTSFDGFTFVFVDTYGFTQGQRGLAFLSIAVGVVLNTAFAPFSRTHYLRHLRAAQEEQEGEGEALVEPEIRLIPAIICAPLFPISLFWMGWTNRPSVSPWSDLVAAAVFGFSLMGIFVSSYQYVIDSYETYSSSALSSITFLRYFVAGGMVIATMPMYQGMGVAWEMTLMGILGVIVTPVPFLFWKYGRKIRARSQFAKKF